MEYVRYLAETIGPRGSTTPKEKEAAAYVEKILGDSGCEPVIETFKSARSSYYPYVLFAGFFLLRIFRHPYSPILSELVEITVETFGPTVCNPVTFGVAVKLAA